MSITLAAPFPSMDRIRALLLLLSSFSLGNPVEVPPTPSAVRRGRAPDARSSTRVYAQGQPLCWTRCPFVVIPQRSWQLWRPWQCRELRRPWQMYFGGLGLGPLSPAPTAGTHTTPPPKFPWGSEGVSGALRG